MSIFRRHITDTLTEELAGDCLFEARGDIVKAQRLARRHTVDENDYRRVAKLIEAAAERINIPTEG